MQYRQDIDGLRAVAVLPVLFYHLKISLFPGGFVGVDIFFVISGYLIGQIILDAIQGGRFTFTWFYERRIRRIIPALVAMLTVSAIAAYAFLLPTEVEDFGKSLVAAVLSTSNIYFWAQSGYFDAPAELKPLLHTWSLGVEEQFYVLFPVFMILVHKFLRERIKTALLLAFVVSLAACVYVTFESPSSAFYLAHLRAWELLLGALLAARVCPRMTHRFQREIASLAGIVLIAFAIFFFSSGTHFPGYAALVPCFGAALVIAAGQDGSSLVGRLLSLRPLVFIGLISYSLYLWHWPLIVFQNTSAAVVQGLSPRATKLVILAVALLFAWLSWKYVEKPFRAGKIGGTTVFRMALAGSACVVVVGALAVALDGLPSRFSPAAIQVARYLDYRGENTRERCFITSKFQYADFDSVRCLDYVQVERNYLLIGDSHAAHLWKGLSATLKDINVMQANASGCKPTIDQPITAADRCVSLMKYIFDSYLVNNKVDKLLISAYWKKSDIPAIARTIDWANSHSIEVILFGPIVVYDSPLPRLLAKSIETNDMQAIGKHRMDYVQDLDREMAGLAVTKNVVYVSLYRTMCEQDDCRLFASKGVPIQYDYGHLTEEGSILVATQLNQQGLLN